jgi:MFS family permease
VLVLVWQLRFDTSLAPWHPTTMTHGTADSPSANALHYPRFVKHVLALAAHGFSTQIMVVALGWQVYALTKSAWNLGLIGLSQFLPALLLVLVTGLVADRMNRRVVLIACLALELVAAIGFVLFTRSGSTDVTPVFGLLVLLGIARAFFNPASDALSPNLLAREAIPHGISLNSMNWQITTITGPVLGGLLYGFGGEIAYGTAAALLLLSIICVTAIGSVPQTNRAEETNLTTMLAGFQFIKSEPIVMGAISLDMVAVFLGGTYALMPIYAADILKVDELGLGFLRAGPGIGAVAMALWLAKFGIKDHAGKILFWCVAGFGLTVVVFGVSKSLPLSIAALIFMGAFDMVSVYIRETLMQLWTPDEVRGRVNAVNRVFIGASNELGEFRAGAVAAYLTAVPAVVIGGAGTIVVAALWSWMFPTLRDAKKLEKPAPISQ